MEKKPMGSYESNIVLELAIKKKYPDRNFWRDRIALELVISQLEAKPLEELSLLGLTYESREEVATNLSNSEVIWNWVETILDPADEAVSRYPDDGQKMKRWTPPSPMSLHGNYDQDQSASLDRLTQCAASYLKGGWAVSPTLELWLVQQMIYAESKAFIREGDVLKKNKSIGFYWAWIKVIGTWVGGVAVAGDVGATHGPGVGLLSLVVWLAVIRYLSQDAADRNSLVFKAFFAMEAAYKKAVRTNACPKEVERALSLGESNHVTWPEGLRGLVEHAVSRNSAAWR